MTQVNPRFTIRPRKLNKELFEEQLSFLIGRCLRGNYSKAGKVLGVSRMTIIRWHQEKKLPPAHYWNMVLKSAIEETIEDMRNSTNRNTKAFGNRVRIDYKDQILTTNEATLFEANGTTGCQQYLLSCFNERSSLNSGWLKREGRYTYSQTRRAAIGLGLKITTKGFGEDKITVFELPDDPQA